MMMNNILKFQEYSKNENLALDFIKHLNIDVIKESKENKYNLKQIKHFLRKISKDLNINIGFMFKFGTGITFMAPIVENLIKNMKLNIDCSSENVILLTVTSLAIVFLDKDGTEEIKKDTRSLLEELKLKGIGNPIVKKILKCIDSIFRLFKKIWNNKLKIVNSFLDLFMYTSLFIPTLNAINYMVNKNSLDLNTLPGNFLSLGMGLSTSAAKHGLNDIIKKIKKYKDKDIENNPVKNILKDQEIINEEF